MPDGLGLHPFQLYAAGALASLASCELSVYNP